MQLTVRQLRRLITEADATLFEGKIDDLQVKYPTLDVKEIAKHDPSGPAAKYLGWMLKQLAKGHSTSDLYPSIEFFHKNISRFQKKDLNAYSDLKDLESAVKSLPEKSKTQAKKQVKSEEAAKIYEDDQQVVVRPDSKKACIAYGGNTKWCITMGDASYYEEYTSQNVVFYFVISKNLDQADPMAKVALAVLRDDDNAVIGVDYYDAVDDQLTEADCEQRIDRFADILQKVKADAAIRPMGFLAKIKSGKATADEIRQNFKDSDVKFRELLAQSKNVPVDVLAQLATDEDRVVRSYVAGNPSTPADILMQLAKDESGGIRREVARIARNGIRREVARNPSTSVDVLKQLAADKDAFVRQYVAHNPSTPGDVLKQLAADEDEWVRWCVARNPSTPVDVLRQLAVDKGARVRQCVARHPSTPGDVLKQLAADKDRDVRERVAVNVSTPVDILKQLATDKDVTVRRFAKRNLNFRNKRENTLMMTMNQLRRLITEADATLFEGKVDDLQVKYPTLDVKEIAKHDPSGSAAKYLGWMLKQLAKGHSTSDLYPSIEFFHKNISRFPQKDLNAYSDLKDLESAVKSLPTKSKTQAKKQVKSEEAAKIYEDDQQVVVRPDTKKACIAYGGNTKWCITMANASYYEEYTSQNVVFYFVISKVREQSNPMVKVAVAVMRDDDNTVTGVDYYDAVDDQLTEADCEQRIDRFADILQKVKADAAIRPMGVLAKVRSGKATADEIRQNFKDLDVETRQQLARSKNVPADVMKQLAVDKDRAVRWDIAANRSTPEDILAQLATDEDTSVRWHVANNPQTAVNVLKQLAVDKEKYVRRCVAGNSQTPVDVLGQLATDEDQYVRLRVADNVSTPVDILKLLATTDKGDNVRQSATDNLNSRNQHENTLMMTMNQLRCLLSEVTVSDDCWGGSQPEETYDEELVEDDAWKQKSVLVPDDVKKSINAWMGKMGLAGRPKKRKR